MDPKASRARGPGDHYAFGATVFEASVIVGKAKSTVPELVSDENGPLVFRHFRPLTGANLNLAREALPGHSPMKTRIEIDRDLWHRNGHGRAEGFKVGFEFGIGRLPATRQGNHHENDSDSHSHSISVTCLAIMGAGKC